MRRRTSRTVPAINAALAPFTARRDPHRVLASIMRRHHINETDDPEFMADMRFLLTQVATVSNLSPIGWRSFTGDIQARMVNRARVRRLIADHPAIADERIEAPIVVVGLPRTATTLTHHIIAGAEGVRGPLLWEWMHTDLSLGAREQAKIIRQVEAAMRAVMFLTPAMLDIHAPQARRPDECAFFLPHTEGHLARAPMPRYETWLKTRDFADDYAYLKQGLQVLQYGRPRARWVLKCPTHLGHLRELMQQFPDATIVWTHRDPVDVVGSICSLVETSRAMHLHRLGPDHFHDIGRMAIATMSALVERGRVARTQIRRDRIIDLRYPALTAQPHGVVEKLFSSLDLEWTRADHDRVTAATARRPGRPHEYTLYRYGLNETDIQDAFGDYGKLADPPIFGSSV